MTKVRMVLVAVTGVIAAFVITQGLRPARAAGQSTQMSPRVGELEWPLPAMDKTYGVIDGHHIWQYVKEQAQIAEHYRDSGHPQLWGRIIGTSADAEDAQWLLNKFKQIGLSNAHIQQFDLQPQWFPQSWSVTITSGGKTETLESAQPVYSSPGTNGSVLDLQAVWVGLGTPADFVGRDVRGKAVFISSTNPPGFCPQCTSASESPTGPLSLAAKKGAAALFYVYTALPGNVKYESYPTGPNYTGTQVPTFALGKEDGQRVAEMTAQASGPLHVKVRMDVKMVRNLKTALVWGTLPGATDETIYVVAHRDGWFDAATDNASGVASMLGLAEYFAKIPKGERRRTMVFVGLDGHHNTGPGCCVGEDWLAAHRQLFTKTALLINDEHVSSVVYAQFEGKIGSTNTYIPLPWYAGGASRPELEGIVAKAFDEFGVAADTLPRETPPAGDLGLFYKFLPGLEFQTNDFIYFHTDENTPETVSWSGLQAITRADAKIIDEVNKLDLKDLQRPASPP
jgi:Peptidase family M28